MPPPAANSLAVIGAGPVGLEAAVAALDLGFDVHVFERGEVAAHPIAWGHVRMFTPWRLNLGPHAHRRLAAAGWQPPDPEAHPTGLELAERYLEPLARLPELEDRVHAFAQVAHVSRQGLRRHEGDAEARRARPFRLLVRDQGGRESVLRAFALVDATGVYAHPEWAGSGGIPARGEAYLRPQMSYHLDDVLGLDRERYAGKRTLVIGGGTCAATVVADLARLAAEAPGTSVAWVTRARATALDPGRSADPLLERRALCERARALAAGAEAAVVHVGGAEVEGFEFNSATHRYRAALAVGEETRVEEADRVLVLAGYRADESLGRELQASEPRLLVLGHKAVAPGAEFLLESGYAEVETALSRLAQETRSGVAL